MLHPIRWVLTVATLIAILGGKPKSVYSDGSLEVPLELGVRAYRSWTSFKVSGSANTEGSSSNSIGGFARFDGFWLLPDWAAFQPELLYVSREGNLGTNIEQSLSYLETHILVRGTVPGLSPMTPYLVGGGAINLMLSSQRTDLDGSRPFEDLTKRWDLSLVIGAGAAVDVIPDYRLFRNLLISIEIRYEHGLFDVIETDFDVRNRSWFLTVGISGAIKDRDGDGIKDSADGCPRQVEDGDGFNDEDGCPDPDNDDDGLMDADDGCPNESEGKKDGFQDEDGCPDPDNDGDTILDEVDKCPEQVMWEPFDKPAAWSSMIPAEIEPLGNELGGYGCKPTFKYIEITRDAFVLKTGIDGFVVNKFALSTVHKRVLDEVAKALAYYPELELVIRGHTDPGGTPSTNENVSQDRANAVRDYLVKKGIASSRLNPISLGEENPIEPLPTPPNPLSQMTKKERKAWDKKVEPLRRLNRRVDFAISK
ncbi:MAG: OmpA family protein [Proteobacteria bacterium]|nr:OmpA family protein [Pseudomonadota bacterium]